MKKLNVLVPSVLALFVASAAHAGATFDTPQGKLNIGGDVEFDVTADNYAEGQSYNATTGAWQGADATDSQHADGRILLDINGERVLANGNFAGFKLNPMWGQQGNNKGADDAWFNFGVKNDWAFKIGHFEAYNLTPDGQDTYVANSGMMMYRAKDGRGRNSSQYGNGDYAGGHILLSKEAGQWHMELGTQFGADGDTTGSIYQAAGIASSVKNKDPLLARPIVAWTGDTVTVAAGAEINLISDAYTTAANGEGESLSDWTGYGLTSTVKATDDLSFTLSGTYRTADEFDQYTVGPSMQYQNFFLAYFYGSTDFDDNTINERKEHLTYASYKIPGVMGLDNFDMYLGTSYGKIDAGQNDDREEYGARVRFKYFF